MQYIEQRLAQRVAIGLERVFAARRHAEWRLQDEAGITPTQSQLLRLLAAQAPHPLKSSTLAVLAELSGPTVSAALAALARKGLVDQARDPNDRRARALRLTAAGATLATRLSTEDDVVTMAIGLLAETEQRGLLLSVIRLIRALKLQGALSSARTCLTCRQFDAATLEGDSQRHHCHAFDQPLADRDLRADCAAHQGAPEDMIRANTVRLFDRQT